VPLWSGSLGHPRLLGANLAALRAEKERPEPLGRSRPAPNHRRQLTLDICKRMVRKLLQRLGRGFVGSQRWVTFLHSYMGWGRGRRWERTAPPPFLVSEKLSQRLAEILHHPHRLRMRMLAKRTCRER
jgi:hypothetical protein